MRKLLYLLFLFLFLPAKGQKVLHLTLGECIQYAETNNPTLQSGELGVNISEIQLRQAQLKQYPTISAGIGQNLGYSHGSGNFTLGGDYDIRAAVDIFRGLSIRNSIKQSKLQVNQSQLQLEETKNQIRVEVIRSYLTILMNEEMLSYQRTVMNTSRQQITEGEQRYKVGQILESDFLLLKAQYYSDSINIENTEIAIENEYSELRDLLNLNREDQLVVVIPDSLQLAAAMTVPELSVVLQQSLDYLPVLKIKKNNVELAEYDLKIAKGSYYPTISASAGVGTGYHTAYGNNANGLQSGLYNNLSESAGISINIPIYQQGSVRNNVKIKNMEVKQAELSLEDAEADLIREIEEYHFNVRKAYNNYTLSELQKDAYYANFMAYSQQFKYGTITTVDLLQQQTNYLNILNNFMQNKYNFLLQKKVLDVYTGQTINL